MRKLTFALLLLCAASCPSFARGLLSGYCTQGGQTIQVLGYQSSAATPVQASYTGTGCNVLVTVVNGPSGYVSTSGTTVTWVSGSLFNTNGQWAGLVITIDGSSYTILSCSSTTSCTLGTSAGTQASVAYSMPTTAPAAIYSDNNGTPKSNPFSVATNGYWYAYADNGTYAVTYAGTSVPSSFADSRNAVDPIATIPFWLVYNAAIGTVTQQCSAAQTAGVTLVVSQPLPALGTQSLACNMLVTAGGSVQPANGATVSITGNVLAGRYKIIDESLGGTVSFSNQNIVYPEWFGATGAGSPTSDCTGFTEALAAGLNVDATGSPHYYVPCSVTTLTGQQITFAAGSHQFGNIVIPDSSTQQTYGNVAIIGAGSALTTIQQVASTAGNLIQSNSFYSLFDSGNKYGVNGFTLRGVTLDGNSANQSIVTASITAVGTSSPISITTSAAHGYSTNNVVCQHGVGGRPEADGCFVVTVTGGTTYTLNGTSSISSNTYTSGGTATASKQSCLVLYGIGYIIDDVQIQNCAVEDLLSGWDVEPSGGYVSALDNVPASFSKLRLTGAGFDGARYYGPHDAVFVDTKAWNNAGWGFAVDTIASVAAGGAHVHTLNIYGNTDGAIYANGPLDGSDVAPTGTTANGLGSNPWGMYIGPDAGVTLTSVLIGGGTIPLEVAGSNNTISGIVSGTCATDCIKLDTGYGNTFVMNGNGINSGYLYGVFGESALNTFIAYAVPVGSTGALLDPSHLPQGGDTVDVSSNTPVPSQLLQQARQLTINPVSAAPGTITTSSSSPTVTGSGTSFTPAMVGATITDNASHSCTVESYSSPTSMSCTGNFPVTNASGVPYIITNLPPVVSASTGVARMLAYPPFYAPGGALLITNSFDERAIIGPLNGASPSTVTWTFPRPFTGNFGSNYFCSVAFVIGNTNYAAYTPGLSGNSTTLTLTGPNGNITDYWSVDCAGH